MKKNVCGWIIVFVMLFCVPGAVTAEESPEDAAPWIITESSEITAEARAAFDSAAEELAGGIYEPVALLAEQAGVYCILCRVTGDDEGAEPYYTLIYVGENGVQNTWDLWIADHSRPRNQEERTVDLSALLSDLAASRRAADTVRSDLEALRDDGLAELIAEKWNGIYMNPDYRLWIDGTDNPADLPIRGKHAFVVLGYELLDGEMTEELKARCDAAAAAAAVFPDSILVCSGGATGENNPDGHTEAGLMKEYMIRNCGIPAERIWTDESALSTLENAVNTFAILKEQQIESVTIVTSAYHQPRANILYQTLAEICREKEGFSIAFAGNYSCAFPPSSEEIIRYDADIAAMQLDEMLKMTGAVPE